MGDTIKKYAKLILAAVLIAALGYGAGWYSKPAKVDRQEVKVRDEEYTRQQVQAARAEWEKTTHSTTTSTTLIKVPCPPPTTEPYVCKPPCATDCTKCPSQTISTTTTTTTDTTEHGKKDTDTTTTEHKVSHETDTIHTVTENSTASPWDISLIASSTVFDGLKLTFTQSYGVGIGRKLIGPLDLSAALYTDKTLIASLSLGLGKDWYVSADAGSRVDKLSPFYGGSVGRRLLGPVWLNAWATNDRAVGLAASFSVR